MLETRVGPGVRDDDESEEDPDRRDRVKKIIELMPLKVRVYVPCSTKDLGKNVMKVCQAST